MKKTVLIFTLSLILTTTLMFSCGGGGGGVDEAIDDSAFTITYDFNGGYGTMYLQNGDANSPQTIADNMFYRYGYLFEGWNTKTDGLGTNYAPGTSYKGKSIILYAKWAAIFNVQVITPASPVPALDGVQLAPGVSYLKILGLTAKGRTLSNIVIPEIIDGYQVNSIGAGAFQGCDTVTDFSIPETVTAIEDNAFADCTGITTVTIPRSVTSIGSGTFSGCSGLSNLILLNPTPPAMGANALEGCTATVSVPAAGVDAYKTAEGWDTYSASIAGYSTEIYTVTFEDQGATTAPSFISKDVVPPAVTIGQLPTPPQRTGYNFGGWFKEPLGAGGEFTASTVVSSNITVYAKWDEYSYTVRFNDQGATTPVGETSKTVSSPNTTVGTLPTEPANVGYYFGGWNTKSDGTGTVFTANTLVTGDITVYAIWLNNPPYTVTFEGQGATTDANPTSKQVVSPAVTVGSLPTPPLKTGYIFGGWFNEPGGAGGEFTESTIVTANKTVYAKWDSYRYTVTFNGQDPDSGPDPSSKTVASPNTTVGLLPTSPAKAGFYFGGWNTKENGTGTSFTADTTVTSDITVYAIWIKNPTYTVTFEGQGATTDASPTSKQVVSPAVTVGSLPTSPERTGYIFGGWFNEPDGAGGEFTASTVVTKDITVYAKWTANTYQITYKDKGNSAFSGIHGNNHPTAHTYGTDTILVSPSKDGYTFGGWFTDSNCSSSPITRLNATSYTNDITIYAKWTYCLIINKPAGGNVTADKTNDIDAGELVTLTIKPNKGMYLSSLVLSNGSLKEEVSPRLLKYTFTMPENNVEVTAAFSNPPYLYVFAPNSNIDSYYLNEGDIVLETGGIVSAQVYTDYCNKIIEIDGVPVGVVAYKADSKAYMIGLKEGNEKWCLKEAQGYSYQVTTDNGYNNTYSLIQKKSDYNETNYPAFAYAINYSSANKGDKNTALTYSTGWFIPSESEWNKINNNKATIKTSIDLINSKGGDAALIDNSPCWTSTNGSESQTAKYCILANGKFYEMIKTNSNDIRVIRLLGN